MAFVASEAFTTFVALMASVAGGRGSLAGFGCLDVEEGYYKIHPNKNVIESFFAVLHPTWVALS